MTFATAIDAIATACAAAGLGVLWLIFLRSLRQRRHPLRWAIFLVVWTAALTGWLTFVHRLDVSATQRIVLVLQLAYLSWLVCWHLSRILRHPWIRVDPYRWSRSDKRALWLATGVVLSGFVLVGGFIAFAALRGTTSPLTVINDSASPVMVLVGSGCQRDSGFCTGDRSTVSLLRLSPGRSQRIKRARGPVSASQLLGFVWSLSPTDRRCRVSLDGGSHALISRAPSCPIGSASSSGGLDLRLDGTEQQS